MPPIHHHPYHHHQPLQQTNSNSTAERSSKRKIFQCKGFGNCSMVFTRSEHLARHTRKHTGEKPYKCIVLGCNRMFSRFDNMMQHTQTHQRNNIMANKQQRAIPGTATPTAAVAVANITDDDEYDDEEDEGVMITTATSTRDENETMSIAATTTGTAVAAAAAATSYNDCGGLMSPVSLGSPDWNHHQQQTMPEEHPHPVVSSTKQIYHQRSPATTDLCNSPFEAIHLTMDEFEALEGFARFREAPLFYESLRNLASVACIEPRPHIAACQQENCL